MRRNLLRLSCLHRLSRTTLRELILEEEEFFRAFIVENIADGLELRTVCSFESRSIESCRCSCLISYKYEAFNFRYSSSNLEIAGMSGAGWDRSKARALYLERRFFWSLTMFGWCRGLGLLGSERRIALLVDLAAEDRSP